ncbi:MAG TPA: SusC/RagA family TonB-linked outer membrane protein [Hanamia sp.]|nr:SusC/RagA family TonB-linked outer membrane protein [Hanamia sp.]
MRKFLVFFTMLMLSGVLAYSQTRVVTGIVKDETGAPVPFATILEKGTKNAATADANGHFSVRVKGEGALYFTASGYASITVTPTGNTADAVMKKTYSELNTVVVTTALGIQRQQRSLGYATTKISASQLTDAKVTNVGDGLAGKVSGLEVDLTNNGVKPDLRVTLRGDRSILGNNEPLLVVDGIELPMTYLATINPDDVANVVVLKGGSASALYGSAASNGVIIVTTKTGTAGKPQIRLSSTATIESIAYTPKFQNSFGQYGGEPIGFEGTVLFPENPYVPYVAFENQNYGPRFNGEMVPLGLPITIFNPDGTSYQKQDSIPYSAVPGAKTGFFNKGLTTQNEISYSAGDDKSKFYLSFQDVNAAGIIPKDVSRRDAFRINGSRTSGIFSAEYNIAYTLTHNNTTAGAGVPFDWGTTGSFGGYPGGGSYFQNRAVYWEIINQPASVNLKNYKNWQTNPFASPDGYFNAYYGNPWWQIDETRLDEKQSDLLGNLALTLKPLSWLSLQYKVGIARDDYSNKYTGAGYTFASWAVNDPAYQEAGYIPSSVVSFPPSEGDGSSLSQRLTSAFLASLHKDYGNFDIRFIAGAQGIDTRNRYFQMSSSTLVIPDFYNISNRLGTPNVGETETEIRTYGVFGDLSIGYKDMLFLHGSLRNDWTSLLAPAHRSYLYPDVDAAFVFTDAISSLKNSNVLSYGKLRAAYSHTAQVSIGAYALQNTFNNGPGFPYPSTAGYSLSSTFANPNILPEISANSEVGLDLGFFKNRINFSAALYNTDTRNQTIQISLSSTTGYTAAYVNSGEMQNKGIELDLNLTPVINTKSGFRWDFGINYAYNKNTLQSLGYSLSEVDLPNYTNQDGSSNANVFESAAVIGLPYAQVKTSDWLRDPQGKIIVDPTTGMPSLSPNQRLFGTSIPPTKFGLTTTFSYKGFTLNATADGRFGAVIYNGIGGSLDFTGVSAYSASSGRQPLVIPNSVYMNAAGKYVPNTNITTQNGNLFWAQTWNLAGSNYVNSADFWKLRELSLSYTFPKKWLTHLKIVNAINVGITGRNLITWKAKDNVWSDPEFSNTNGNASGNTDINQLPPTKFVGANLNVTF